MITVDNCHSECDRFTPTGDISSKAAAWAVVYNLCLQQGMDIHSDKPLSGLQKVVDFIISKTTEQQA